MYFLYGESVIYYFKHILLVDKVLLPLANHHRFISFTLYVMGQYPEYPPVVSANIQSQASCSLSDPCRKATTDSSSLSLPGRTWLCT
jgi:hypothetical protein